MGWAKQSQPQDRKFNYCLSRTAPEFRPGLIYRRSWTRQSSERAAFTIVAGLARVQGGFHLRRSWTRQSSERAAMPRSLATPATKNTTLIYPSVLRHWEQCGAAF